MIEIELDGRRIGAQEGETVLAAARRVGIHIPALCYHAYSHIEGTVDSRRNSCMSGTAR